MTNFEKITASPETLGTFLASLPIASGPWDEAFHRMFCDGCQVEDCDGQGCPHKVERGNPLWWLMQEAEGQSRIVMWVKRDGYLYKPYNHINRFRRQGCGRLLHKGSVAAAQVQHPRLVAEHHPVSLRCVIQPDVKRMPFVSVGDRTDHRQAADAVEQVVADHKRRTASPLLVSSLGIKVQIDNVPLPKNGHHTSSPALLPQSISFVSRRGISSTGLP